jgi:hypothetical protein
MSESAAPDPLEEALDEVYGVEPGDFVPARKRLAAELRAAGHTAAAKSLLGARRPTTAAWALNQLSRRDPGLVQALLDRSRELEAAQVGEGTGGREGIREATRSQRQALAAATEATLAMLGPRASDAYRAQILATLHAASAEAPVAEALQSGRLVRESSGSTGFPEFPGLTLVPDLDLPAERKRPSQKSPPGSRAPKLDRTTRETIEEAERARLERERVAAERAERRLREAEAASRTALDEAEAAEAVAAAAHERLEQLTRDLDGARRDARAADEVASRARREAARLARAATKLRSQSR